MLPLFLLLSRVHYIVLHGALIAMQSATVIGAERPWWEADIQAEMARIEAQNEAIRSDIETEMRFHNAEIFSELEATSAMYLKQTEQRWTENDESVIRSEIERVLFGKTRKLPDMPRCSISVPVSQRIKRYLARRLTS